jgi:fatty-acyl-CoA synthase
VGYGMSETCLIISLAHPMSTLDWESERQLDVVIKTGRPIPLADLEVVDPLDAPLPHDGKTVGEVVMRTPWLTVGYSKDTERSAELWRSGWLHSGDVGYIDAEGFLQITDRIKDVIKSGGEWISSLDLENLLSQHPAVLESAAIAVKDEKWGERPQLFVVLKPSTRARWQGGPETVHGQIAEQGSCPNTRSRTA